MIVAGTLLHTPAPEKVVDLCPLVVFGRFKKKLPYRWHTSCCSCAHCLQLGYMSEMVSGARLLATLQINIAV